MGYRAVGSRCALDFDELTSEAREHAHEMLVSLGFVKVDADPVDLARSRVGHSRFVKRVFPARAPHEVNCSSFMKWVFGRCGIWLPCLAVQQREMGQMVAPEEMAAGDLIFVTARFNLYQDDPRDGLGHVGIVTGQRTVIHAKGATSGVVEEKVERFLAPTRFRGLRRLVAPGHRVVTYEIPDSAFVETSDDIKWIIIMNLGRLQASLGK